MEPRKFLAPRQMLAACAVAALAVLPPVASGQTFNLSNGTLSGTAAFTLGTDSVHLVLTNTTPNVSSTAQLLSDISFSISGGLDISTTSVVPTGNLVTCANITGCTSTGGSANAWFYGMNGSVGSQGDLGSGTYILTALVGNNRSLILSSGTLNCNPKCPDGLANTVNQPYLQPSGTFDLTIPGVTSTSQIEHVVLSFGTGPETVVPIPAAVWLFGSGLLALIGIARRRMAGAVAPEPAMA